jgi:hypothetical protein
MRGAIVARGTVIGADHLILDDRDEDPNGDDLSLAAAIARHVREVLEHAGGDDDEAALLLGISKKELHEHLDG